MKKAKKNVIIIGGKYLNYKELEGIVESVPKEYGFSFAKNTTYGLGGSAKCAYFPQTKMQAAAVFSYLNGRGEKIVTLGNGSNVLASDKPFDGSVISTKNLVGITPSGSQSIFCMAGVRVSTLLDYCVKNGFGGLEYLAGIPASIGGLVYMNGGAGGKYISGNVINVELFDSEMRVFSNKLCNFGYKYSTMRDINALILGAELKIYPETPENVRKNIHSRLEMRAGQPKGKSCGCVFKNADGVSAGEIIDRAGLKGLRCGGAYVSTEHANFIINDGGCASDVRKLIKEVKKRVLESQGIALEEEVVYIGDL